MSRIYVEYDGLKQISDRFSDIASSIDDISSKFASTVAGLDWDISFQQDILATGVKLTAKMKEYTLLLKKYDWFLDLAYLRYLHLDEYAKLHDRVKTINDLLLPGGLIGLVQGTVPHGLVMLGPGGNPFRNLSADDIKKDIAKYFESGNGTAAWKWFGADGSAENGTASGEAYIGKGSASWTNGDFSADAGAELGHVKGTASAHGDVMKDGKLVDAGAEAEASVVAAHGKASAKYGNDDASVKGEVEGSVGHAEASAKGNIKLDKDGLEAEGKFDLHAAALEGQAIGTVTIGLITVKGGLHGSLGSLGIKGDAGYKDGKVHISGDVALGGGAGGEFEVGLSDKGKAYADKGKKIVNDVADFAKEGLKDGAENLGRGFDNLQKQFSNGIDFSKSWW